MLVVASGSSKSVVGADGPFSADRTIKSPTSKEVSFCSNVIKSSNRKEDIISIKEEERRNVPRLNLLSRKSKTLKVGSKKRKQDIKLTDYGVTFERYRDDLAQGILRGYKPHFGYPLIQFNNIKEGLKALNYEDASGEPDPIMSIVNSDSI